MNRVTGVALSVGITGIGALAIAGVDSSAIMTFIGSVPVAGQVGGGSTRNRSSSMHQCVSFDRSLM